MFGRQVQLRSNHHRFLLGYVSKLPEYRWVLVHLRNSGVSIFFWSIVFLLVSVGRITGCLGFSLVAGVCSPAGVSSSGVSYWRLFGFLGLWATFLDACFGDVAWLTVGVGGWVGCFV